MSITNERVQPCDLMQATEVLFPDKREKALHRMQALGFINAETLPVWKKELLRPEYQARLINYLIGALKLGVDRELEHYGGELTRKKTLTILENVRQALMLAKQTEYFRLDKIRETSAMDLGAGVYSTLSASIVLFANGFCRAIAFEPYPLKSDWVVQSVAQTLQWLAFEPDLFNFSGIAAKELKHRAWSLDFEHLADRLAHFNRSDSDTLDFGGVLLTKRMNALAPESVDLLFSNSVLEHIQDPDAALRDHKQLLSPNGRCVHTVDFSDHRAQGTGLNLFQMYYDGVLEDINGLRPSQLERKFLEAGFAGTRIHKLSAPKGYIPSTTGMVKAYADISIEELSIMVNSYVLTRKVP